MNHPAFRDPQILDPADRKTLFSYIIPVLECSDRLLCDLESSWQDNVMLVNLSKNIFKHAEKHFHVYISYCEHQGRLDRTLKRLKESNTQFKENLDLLENDSVCCGLNLHSFLMLPMQRITRLPLLIDAVMTKLKSNDDEFDDWKMTLAILNKVRRRESKLNADRLLTFFLFADRFPVQSSCKPLRAGIRNGNVFEADRVSRQHYSLPANSIQRNAKQSTAKDAGATRRAGSHHLSR